MKPPSRPPRTRAPSRTTAPADLHVLPSPPAVEPRAALTLRTLAGLTTAVLGVLYLLFSEGYAAGAGDEPIRRALTDEAIRLGRLLVRLLPGEPEAGGLLALMLLHDARRAARADGASWCRWRSRTAPWGTASGSTRAWRCSTTCCGGAGRGRTGSRRPSPPATPPRPPSKRRRGGRSPPCTPGSNASSPPTSSGSTTTGGGAAAAATPRPTRWSARSRTSPRSSRRPGERRRCSATRRGRCWRRAPPRRACRSPGSRSGSRRSSSTPARRTGPAPTRPSFPPAWRRGGGSGAGVRTRWVAAQVTCTGWATIASNR